MNLAALHQFWFDEIKVTHAYYQTRVPLWFFGNDLAFDRACEVFSPLFFSTPPTPGGTPREHLAKILLFDQIPRNAYRNGSLAHAFDLTAVHLSLEAIGTSFETELSLPERIFLYLPLEHAEDIDLQNLSVTKFHELYDHSPIEIRPWAQLALSKALEHRETIRRFGRFPQRNIRLGRASSRAELAFLESRSS